MTKSKDPSPEEILRKIDLLNQGLDTRESRAREEESGTFGGQARRRTSAFYVFAWQSIRSFRWLWRHTVSPITRWFWRAFKFCWGKYRILWDMIVNYRDEYGKERFSVIRGGLMLGTTGVFLYYIAIPMLILLLWQLPIYALTVRHDETVWLTNSQETAIESVFSIQGCHHVAPCDDNDSIYYRVRSNLFNELWSILHGRGIFFPDLVAAVVPPSQWTKCVITSYGFRFKIFLGFSEVYPDLLKVVCYSKNSD